MIFTIKKASNCAVGQNHSEEALLYNNIVFSLFVHKVDNTLAGGWMIM